MTTKVSDAVVDQAFDLLITVNKPLRTSDVAHRLGVGKTTASAALRTLHKQDIVTRSRGNSLSVGGQPPWVYSLADATNTLDDAVVASRSTTGNRPPTLKRARRGDMPDLVRRALPHWKPNGRGFTITQMQKQVGQGSYETVRRAVDQLVESGEVVPTGKHRKGSRLYVPAGEKPSTIAAPNPPALFSVSNVDDLLERREELRRTLSAAEVELAQIEQELDRIRERLA